MQHDWILGVLSDLQAFAKTNGLEALGEQLDDTRLIAMAELACIPSEGQARAHGESPTAGRPPQRGGSLPDA